MIAPFTKKITIEGNQKPPANVLVSPAAYDPSMRHRLLSHHSHHQGLIRHQLCHHHLVLLGQAQADRYYSHILCRHYHDQCGSGDSASKLRAVMSSQSMSGGGGGIQLSGYEESQSVCSVCTCGACPACATTTSGAAISSNESNTCPTGAGSSKLSDAVVSSSSSGKKVS
jgi:hypothetical protein